VAYFLGHPVDTTVYRVDSLYPTV